MSAVSYAAQRLNPLSEWRGDALLANSDAGIHFGGIAKKGDQVQWIQSGSSAWSFSLLSRFAGRKGNLGDSDRLHGKSPNQPRSRALGLAVPGPPLDVLCGDLQR
jgi:hypothetical protein